MTSRRCRAGFDATRNIKHTRLKNEQDIETSYKFMGLLGKGSFGTVSEAIRLLDQTRWAVKVINKERVIIYCFSYDNIYSTYIHRYIVDNQFALKSFRLTFFSL